MDLKGALRFRRDPAVEDFSRYFRKTFGGSLLAVILYGSCMSRTTRRPTSTHDFILICDNYRAFYRKKRLAVLNYILPPNVFYVDIPPHRRGNSTGCLACKYNVLSMDHLKRETSPGANDIFIFGRLGKRVGIVYAKNSTVFHEIASCISSAMSLNLSYLLPTLPREISLDDLIIRLLSMSYKGDYRVERDTKVAELFNAEKDYYRRAYGQIVEEAHKNGEPISKKGSLFRVALDPEDKGRRLRRTTVFLKKSRRHSVYRWPKALMTFGNYVDYLLTKVERSKGIRIELTPWERRVPLVLGWRHFFRLRRQGHLK